MAIDTRLLDEIHSLITELASCRFIDKEELDKLSNNGKIVVALYFTKSHPVTVGLIEKIAKFSRYSGLAVYLTRLKKKGIVINPSCGHWQLDPRFVNLIEYVIKGKVN